MFFRKRNGEVASKNTKKKMEECYDRTYGFTIEESIEYDRREQMAYVKKYIKFYKKHKRMPNLPCNKEGESLWEWRFSVKYNFHFRLFPDVQEFLLSEVPDFFKGC